jgi:hypothetical protein
LRSVISRVDAALRFESQQFGLRFGCEDCAYHDAETGRCGNGYPNEPHRDVDLERAASVVFCKEFELA